jgi:hypothetical protein
MGSDPETIGGLIRAKLVDARLAPKRIASALAIDEDLARRYLDDDKLEMPPPVLLAVLELIEIEFNERLIRMLDSDAKKATSAHTMTTSDGSETRQLLVASNLRRAQAVNEYMRQVDSKG